MIVRDIWKQVPAPLELHTDDRGSIVDVFYNDDIHHVAVIKSKAGARRGDHYHKESTQHMLITKGSLEYWYKQFDSDNAPQCVVVKKGQIVSTPPLEIHALRIIKDNEFIVLTSGKRGGKDYESDTFRIKPSIIQDNIVK